MAKVFISYRRVEPDQLVAKYLYRSLSDLDHDVFIDAQDVTVGQFWDKEIRNNLERSEWVVCLISLAYLHSKFIIEKELAVAGKLLKEGKINGILLINLAYDGEPPEQVRDVVTQIQFLKWRSDQDTEYVTNAIAEALPRPQVIVKGMRAFDTTDEELFAELGREDEITRFVELVNRKDTRLVLLYGQSGAGKTSFIKAGLIPRIVAPTNYIGLSDPKTFDLTTLHQDGGVFFLDQFEQWLINEANDDKNRALLESTVLDGSHGSTQSKLVFSIRDEYRTAFETLLPELFRRCSSFPLLAFKPQVASSILIELLTNVRVEHDTEFVSRLCPELADGSPPTVRPALLQLIAQYCQRRGISLNKGTWDLFQKQGLSMFESHVQESVLDQLTKSTSEIVATQTLVGLTSGEVKSSPKTIIEIADSYKLSKRAVQETLERAALPHARIVTAERAGALSEPRYQLMHDLFATACHSLHREAKRRSQLKRRAAIIAALLILLTVAVGLAVTDLSLRRLAETRLADYRRLADVKLLADYLAEADQLWPAYPENISHMEDWLAKANVLAARLEIHQANLANLRQRALPDEQSASEHRAWKFANTEDQWQHDTLSELVRQLESFTNSDPKVGAIASVRERLNVARTIQNRTLDDFAAQWDLAINSIADPQTCPQYKGLKIKPQLGLIPIGRDAHSGLWEFLVYQSGEKPKRGPDGQLILSEDMGIVLVLIPGTTFTMGAERPTPEKPAGSPNVDADAYDVEGPLHSVTLEPFFISKYEMTQGQWLKVTGKNPSQYGPGNNLIGARPLLHPVENVSWYECNHTMFTFGLVLPTEAQLECATRAGTVTVWWTGNNRESLRGAANLADQAALRAGQPWPDAHDWPGFDDGFALHAPVGSFRPNAFGLHDVHGNVWEWCKDNFGSYKLPVKTGDGERLADDPTVKVDRNGDYMSKASYSRSAFRDKLTPDYRYFNLGVRPTRMLMK